jgi:GABA(A) receptor-associated protein
MFHKSHSFNFKKSFDYTRRLQESNNIMSKYDSRYPIIVEVNPKFKDKLKLDKHKYLVPGDITMGQFLYVLRKRIKLSQSEALFIFLNNSIPCTSTTINILYDTYKDIDNFLYLTLSMENTFG